MGRIYTTDSASEVSYDGTSITHLSRRSILQADCNKCKLTGVNFHVT